MESIERQEIGTAQLPTIRYWARRSYRRKAEKEAIRMACRIVFWMALSFSCILGLFLGD